ncbi:MAG TPA: NosD domain-containing protein [Acidimicrobiia bacterium]|nr:NosD domain-containing protein [Acidimicrobiia bacterium]
MGTGRIRRFAVGVVAAAVATFGAAVAVAPAASADGGGARHLYVAPTGNDGPSCGRHENPCRTIGAAVAKSVPGGEISVARGVYTEMVTVTIKLELEGHDATIDATGKINGIDISGPGASWSRVHGFTVKSAIGEGILASGVDHVSIDHDVVDGNDRGSSGVPNFVPNSYMECQGQGNVPGDCGEGVHLQGTTNSRVDDTIVMHNTGGILVSDDFTASHGNKITDNVAKDNLFDCGITMPAHDPAGGVYDNLVEGNVSTGNGGAGVLIAAAGPGMKAYDNVVRDNRIWNNGEGGVQLHAHAPGQSIDGNQIVDNDIGTNNTMGDMDSGDLQTTGIIVFSAVVPVNNLVVRDNDISHDHFGIWLSKNVATQHVTDNDFDDVVMPIFQ